MDGAVLVLNRLYQAIQITGLRRALRLFCAGRAVAVADDFRTYPFEHWLDLEPRDGEPVICTPSRAMRVPSVIQLVRYDQVPRRHVRFSRRNVLLRDRHRCQYCGRVYSSKHLNLDHVVPLSRGGASSWENVVTACIQCNSRKGNRTPEEAGMALIRPPRRPRAHPAWHARWLGRRPDAWRVFLEASPLSVEFCDDIVPLPEAAEQDGEADGPPRISE